MDGHPRHRRLVMVARQEQDESGALQISTQQMKRPRGVGHGTFLALMSYGHSRCVCAARRQRGLF